MELSLSEEIIFLDETMNIVIIWGVGYVRIEYCFAKPYNNNISPCLYSDSSEKGTLLGKSLMLNIEIERERGDRG
jgi:hypothetical protein